jgi:hypothetical protein
MKQNLKKDKMINVIIILNFILVIVDSASDLRGYQFASNSVADVTNFVKVVPQNNFSYDVGITICLRTQVLVLKIWILNSNPFYTRVTKPRAAS